MTARRIVSTVLLGLALACASIDVQHERDEAFDFDGKRRYAWTEGTRHRTEPYVNAAALDAVIRDEVDTRLRERRYRKVGEEAADLLVTYQAAVRDVVGRQAIAGRATARRSLSVSFAVGSIVLEILEPVAGQVVWRGAAQAEVDRWADDAEREDRIRDAVRAILARFPQ